MLFHAGIHPEAVCKSLSHAQAERLLASLLHVINVAVCAGANAEAFPQEWLFHYRWGKGASGSKVPGPNGGAITFLTVGGRTSAVVLSRQRKGEHPALSAATSGASASAGRKRAAPSEAAAAKAAEKEVAKEAKAAAKEAAKKAAKVAREEVKAVAKAAKEAAKEAAKDDDSSTGRKRKNQRGPGDGAAVGTEQTGAGGKSDARRVRSRKQDQ